MFNGLGIGGHAGIQHIRIVGIFMSFSPLSRIPSLAEHVSPMGLRLQSAKYLLQSIDLALGLLQMVQERLPQLRRMGLFGHLPQGLQNLLLRVVDVLEQMDKKVFQRLHFRHDAAELPGLPGSRTENITPHPRLCISDCD
jgi:hypothetical protein